MNNLSVNAQLRHPFLEEKVPWALADCTGKGVHSCLIWLPLTPASELSHGWLCVSEPVSTLTLRNYWNTCAKSLFAKPRWEFSVFNRPQNFSSLPWGEVLWFSSCTWGLHLNHLRSGVRYLLKAVSFLLAFLRHTWIFFFFNFKVRNILPSGGNLWKYINSLHAQVYFLVPSACLFLDR